MADHRDVTCSIIVTKGEKVNVSNTNKSPQLITYHIQIVSEKIDVFYDERYNIYALKDTFEESSSIFSHTDETKWFVSVIKCLQSVKNARFSQDHSFLESVPKQIMEIPVEIDYMQDSYADD